MSNNNTARNVAQYDEDGNFMAWFPSVSAAQRLTGVSANSIRAAARRNTRKNLKHMGSGFVWRYTSTPPKPSVRARNLENDSERYAFRDPSVAYQYLGVRSNDISRVLNGVRNSAGGFVWYA